MFENIIKEKLSSFEYEYNNSSWQDFKKQIPAKKSHVFLKTAVILSAAVLTSIILLNSLFEKTYVCKTNPYHKHHLTTIKRPVVVQKQKNILLNTGNTVPDVSLDSNPSVGNQASTKKMSDNIKINNINTDTTNTTAKNFNQKQEQLPDTGFKISKTEGCSPLVVNFVPDEISDTIIYLWDFGDGSFSNEASPYHTYNSSQIYNTKLTVKYLHSGKIAGSAIHRINVYKKPEVNFKWKYIQDNILQFINLSEDANNFKWYFSEQNAPVSDFDVEYTFKTGGVHIVTLKAVNDNGCVNTISKPVNIEIKHDIFVPEAFVPDNDGKNDLFGIKTCIEIKEFRMNIFDKNGRLVFQSNDLSKQWNGKINGTEKNAEAGIYLWEYTLKDKYNNTVSNKGRLRLIRK